MWAIDSRQALSVLVLIGFALLGEPNLGWAEGAILAAPASQPPETNQAVFHVQAFRETVAPRWAVVRGVMTFGVHQFTFVVPSQYRMQSDSNTLCISLNYVGDIEQFGFSRIVIKLTPAALFVTNTPGPGLLREQWLAEYAPCTVLGEFTVAIGPWPGLGVEAWKSSDQGLTSMMRMANVSLPDAVLELCQTTALQRAAYHRAAYYQLLLSFRETPVGTKLQYQLIQLE